MEKYTMKKIYNILLAGVVMLAFAPLSIAQQSTDIPFPADNTIKFAPDEWNKTYEIDEESGVGYRKIISQPNTKGVYHILLEEFVTGREIKIRKSLPADIVLVLDVSGSMMTVMAPIKYIRPQQPLPMVGHIVTLIITIM